MRCRLCDHDCTLAFERLVLDRHLVEYYVCPDCGALQTEQPYWLDEAYGNAIAALDTGIVTRNLVAQAIVYLVERIVRPVGQLIDFGGGTGMLCRMLRDIGYDAWLMDRYADPVFARGFALGPDQVPEGPVAILSCFEVFEHFAEVGPDIDRLFALRPAVLVASTELYDGQGADWPYLVPETGQHIFFYGRRTMAFIAARHGYRYIGRGQFHFFLREPPGAFRQWALRLAVSRFGLRAARLAVAWRLDGRFSRQDQAALARR
ncbi:MAG TPA: class I SAM-dependent methyltransferase [Aliidongia sp.]|uniref:class I SAM-dependent methyltransferase n=1 Tax=Aliidongia sp. TaxID=1914230 RepID=UPI002DDCA7EF|nr:class I SAM-dependent methyltransferase [Aliidongia sp.]HEV2674877.1 class I SAM-dependent methyltransferase [Aliidongia sp.]